MNYFVVTLYVKKSELIYKILNHMSYCLRKRYLVTRALLQSVPVPQFFVGEAGNQRERSDRSL